MSIADYFELPKPERDAPVYNPQLADLAGMREARRWGEALARDFASYREGHIKWDELDSGALLYGPPGTGKTMFALALAQTCGVKLIATSFSQWINDGDSCLGTALEAIKSVFELAKLRETIIFIDEIDCLPARGHSTKSDSWFNAVVTALLEELNGISGRPGVVVVAACNNKNGLDRALLRAGRLEKHIPIDFPTLDDLPGVIRFHLTKDEARRLGDLKPIAVMCQGMSPADIGRIVRDARRHAREWKHALSQTDFVAAIETEERDTEFDWRVAVHEAGHAVAALTLGLADKVNLSIISRAHSAGTSSFEFKTHLLTASNLALRLTVTLSGRAAEEVVFGEVSGGSGGDETSDLARANSLAWRAVTELGFSRRAPLLWCADKVKAEYVLGDNCITREVQAMLTSAYDEAISLATKQRPDIELLANALVERRALAHADIQRIIGTARTGSTGAPRRV